MVDRRKKKKLDAKWVALILLVVVFGGLFVFFRLGILQSAIGGETCPADTCREFDFKGYAWRADVTPRFGAWQDVCEYRQQTYVKQAVKWSYYDLTVVNDSNSISISAGVSGSSCSAGSTSFKLQTVNISLLKQDRFAVDMTYKVGAGSAWNDNDARSSYTIGLFDPETGKTAQFISKSAYKWISGGSDIKSGTGFVMSRSGANPNRWTLVMDNGDSGSADLSGMKNPQIVFTNAGVLAQQSRPSSLGTSMTITEISQPVGCDYNNPVCDVGFYCANNTCLLNKTGCENNNPACPSGFTCSNNLCLQNAPPQQTVVPQTPSGCAYNNPACPFGYNCSNNLCLQVLGQGCQFNNPACPTGYACNANICQQIVASGCTNHNPDCQVGYVCTNGLCVQNSVPTGCAYDNPACSADYDCQNNACVQRPVTETPVATTTTINKTIFYVALVAILTSFVAVAFFVTRKRRRGRR